VFFRPHRKWQPIDSRVEMRYVPDLSARYFPDADAVLATAWHTAFDVDELPASKGEKFYLIQSYETWAGPKELVDKTWHMPFHKVAVSSWLRKLGLEMGCHDIVHVPDAIDHSRFRLIAPIHARPCRVVLHYSRPNWKGAAEGIEALRAAKERHGQLQAQFYSVFPRPSGLPSWIEFVRNPSLNELVENVLNSGSIFLSANWCEGWGLAPAEAMACGCAVVATDSKGIRDYCDDQVTALLSQPKDVRALTDNLLRVLEDDSLRVRLAEAGHRRIQEFTWERSTDLLEKYMIEQISLRE
jgi:glycosyltransferase involved in cell wall biosynthesis